MRTVVFRGLAIVALAFLFVGAVISIPWPDGEVDQNTNEDLANALFGDAVTPGSGYGLVMVLIGLLLLVALLGGVFLAKEEAE